MPDALAAILALPGVAKVLSILNVEGEEARLVGGAVRNALLGIRVIDIDIATTALPEVVLARARKARIHAVPTGIEHGTVTLVVDGAPYEVTTLREDIETDGRRAKVRFGRDFRADALRRDFTINALSASADGTIHDYAGGIDDLTARRIRFIGDADTRIREDCLRILRFFRFSAAYGEGALDADGLAAVMRHRDGLSQLSRERIRAEMMKLLVAPAAVPVLREMNRCGILAIALGRNADMPRLERLAELEAQLHIAPDGVRRVMALALSSPCAIAPLRESLRLTNREVARMEAIAATAVVQADAKTLLYRLGMENYRDALLLHGAQTGTDIAEALALPARWTPPKFLLTGKDVIALGIAKGPEVSRLLAATEQAWLDAGLPAEEAAQRRILERAVQAR